MLRKRFRVLNLINKRSALWAQVSTASSKDLQVFFTIKCSPGTRIFTSACLLFFSDVFSTLVNINFHNVVKEFFHFLKTIFGEFYQADIGVVVDRLKINSHKANFLGLTFISSGVCLSVDGFQVLHAALGIMLCSRNTGMP